MQHKESYLWGLTSKFGPAFIQLFANMILARLLCPSDFGTVGVLTIIFSVANVLVDSGLGGSLIKEKEISKIDCSTIACFNSGIGLFFFILIFSTAGYIESYFGIDGLADVTRCLSFAFLLGPIAVVPQALLARDLKFKQTCQIAIISVLGASVFAVAMALFGFGVYSLVVLQLANILFNAVLACVYCRYIPRYKFSMSSFRRLIPFGAFTTMTGVIDTIYENLLTTLTGKYLNVQQAGYMSQAKRVEDTLGTTITKTIANVSFPIITKLKENLPRFKAETQSVYRNVPLLVTPALLTVSLFAAPILVLLFGEQWEPTSYYLQALVFAGIVMINETLLRSFIKSFGAVKQLMYITIIKRVVGIAIILASLIINPMYIVHGYIISAFFGFILNAFMYSEIIGVSVLTIAKDTVLTIIPSLAIYLALVAVKQWSDSLPLLIILTAICAAIYIFAILPLYGIKLSKMIFRRRSH